MECGAFGTAGAGLAHNGVTKAYSISSRNLAADSLQMQREVLLDETLSWDWGSTGPGAITEAAVGDCVAAATPPANPLQKRDGWRLVDKSKRFATTARHTGGGRYPQFRRTGG